MEVADQVGGLLKHIPCPEGDKCKNVRCLFGHASAQPDAASAANPRTTPDPPAPIAANAAIATTSSTTAKHRTSFSDDDSSADKRPKIAHTTSSTSPRYGTSTPSSTATSGLQRPISPPPLKRKQENVSTPAKTGQTSASSASGPPEPSVVQDKRKPEALNPRHVAKAPAKHEIRLRLVRMIHQEFMRLNKLLHASAEHPEDRKYCLLNPQGLIWAALDLEEHYATTKPAKVYSDTIKHRIMELKRMTVAQWVKERKEAREAARRARQKAAGSVSTSASTSTSTTATAAAPKTAPETVKASNGTGSKTATSNAAKSTSAPVSVDTGLPPDQEILLLQKHFITPTDKLANVGYVPTVPTDVDIKKARDAEDVSKGWEQCERCTRRFQVFPGRREEDGALTSGGKCQHHPGRLNRATQVFSCCSASTADSPQGCEIAPSHVFKVSDAKRLASQWNFVETPANSDPNVPENHAVCFDCEMAYTVYGMEVVRLTATSWPSGELLLDILVRPRGTVIDFNSRFSGVWPEDIAVSIPYTPEVAEAAKKNKPNPATGNDIKPGSRPPMLMASSPEAARDLFHKLIRPETVLIGHALENDLKAMRMVHTRISDTVLLFPHPKGLPIRYSLRVLAKEHLNCDIQTGGHLTGHDSAEDARVAGELVRSKIKAKWDDLKRRQNWKLIDGVMVQGV